VSDFFRLINAVFTCASIAEAALPGGE